MNANPRSLLVRWGVRLFGGHSAPAISTRRPARGATLGVEALEDRTLPSAAGPALVLPVSLGSSEAALLATAATAAVQGAPVSILGPSIHVHATELNGDSRLDLIVTSRATNQTVLLLNRGDGTFHSANVPEEAGLPAHAFQSDDGTPHPTAVPVIGLGFRRAKGLPDGSLSLPLSAAAQSNVKIPGTDEEHAEVAGSPSAELTLGGLPGDNEGDATATLTHADPGVLIFAPLPVATAYLLSLGRRLEVPELLPLQDSSLGVVGTILSVRGEQSAAPEKADPAHPVAGRGAEGELAGAALSRFVAGQEEALESRPPLTRQELLGPAGPSSPDTAVPQPPAPETDLGVVPVGMVFPAR